MNARSLILSAVLVLGPVACSTPSSPSAQPSGGDVSGAAAPADLKRTEVEAPSGAANEPGTAAPTPSPGDATMTTSTVYIIKDNGKRCFAPPCDHYDLFAADAPDKKLQTLHEIDLTAVTGGDSEKTGELLQRASKGGPGLKVEGTLDKRLKAGPAGDAIVLRATRIVG
ncbi:hypothetical protein D7X96_34715 [Corallococcus interemptor]|uniref:Lipoprotein n=1 Tax=Corallococcus interemptor TaxID=2316720 RepID=A0A3A8PU61_9BACT|nr:DUF6748 domain-containing protein [Corallococcus interemptor]RKH41959.1 hypothetical protein D7Y23_32135 [Corallococcus sp. AB050B]RKH59829.1 hypothetical protein D7X96_34715 [Corallococcus interemptor]